MAVINYKCPCCDATLTFDGTSQQLSCEYCGNSFELDAVKQYDEASKSAEGESDFEWQPYQADSGNGDWQEGETDGMKMYVCSTCGAQIVADENTVATFCLYCENSTIIPETVSGMLKPDFVVPFKKSKEDAKEALKLLCKGKKLLPDFFIKDNRIEKITGLYVPFWLFDGDADAKINYKATKTRHWVDSNYSYTKTDHYMIAREGSIGYNYVPADGSSKADDKFMESIEPFDFDEAVDFNTAYLAGYLADKYDVTSDECKDKINERIRNSTLETFRSTIEGYSTVVPKNINMQIKQGKIRYVLMPVWMLNTKYQGKIYTFAMNGQTGKVAGELPFSKKKYFSYMFGITGVLSVIATIIYLLIF